MRPAVCDLMDLPEVGKTRLKLRQAELQELYGQFDRFFDALVKKHQKKTIEAAQFQANLNPADHLDRKINVRMENGKLVVTELPGEEISASSEHINMYGKYYFNIEEGLQRKELRELRKPSNELSW